MHRHPAHLHSKRLDTTARSRQIPRLSDAQRPCRSRTPPKMLQSRPDEANSGGAAFVPADWDSPGQGISSTHPTLLEIPPRRGISWCDLLPYSLSKTSCLLLLSYTAVESSALPRHPNPSSFLKALARSVFSRSAHPCLRTPAFSMPMKQ